MKRILLIFAVACFALVSCKEEMQDGDWPPMEWENVTYATKTINNNSHYIVPKEGGSYTFVCKNYRMPIPRLFCSYDNSGKNWEQNLFTEAKCKDYSVTITFAPNDTTTRIAYAEFSVGDAGCVLNFVQEGAK